MNNKTKGGNLSQSVNVKRMALVTFSAGCLTFLVAGLALGGGLLLDARLETFPRWTLILLAGSAPLTLGGVYLIVRRTLKRGKEKGKALQENDNN